MHFQIDIQIMHYDSILASHMTWSFNARKTTWPEVYCIACHMLLSKNCVERDYSLISLVLAIVMLVNMSCDKILNEIRFVYDKMWK